MVESIVRDVGEMLMAGEGAGGVVLPTPLRVTDVGLPVALCVIDTEADLAPADVGVKETVTVWLADGDMDAVIGETENCPASVPPTAIPVTDKIASPVFVMANVFVDVTPTVVESIVRDVGETLMAGAGGGTITPPIPSVIVIDWLVLTFVNTWVELGDHLTMTESAVAVEPRPNSTGSADWYFEEANPTSFLWRLPLATTVTETPTAPLFAVMPTGFTVNQRLVLPPFLSNLHGVPIMNRS